ncbi:TPA: hypothetical protein KPB65_003681 [Clostridioides difficile]|nr:hypothetical protein [Clostridioides difficile]
MDINNTKSIKNNKVKLQLSIGEKTKKTAKFIALKNDTNISALFEDYIKAIDKNPQLIKLIRESTK